MIGIDVMFLLQFYQLTWRERGLNWFLYQGLDKQILTRLTYYGFIIQVPAFFIFILLPFSHMLYMVIQLVHCAMFT